MNRAAFKILTGAVLLAGLLGCRHGSRNAATPTPVPATPLPPTPIILTPTVALPPDMGLDARVDPATARTMAAAAPSTPGPITGSRSDEVNRLVPTTRLPTVGVHP